MAIVVEFRWLGKVIQATIDGGKWTCDDPEILHSVQTSAALYPGGEYSPHPDMTEAEFVIKDMPYLHGRIIHADPAPKRRKGVIY